MTDKSLSTDNWDLTLGEGLPGYGRIAPKFEIEYLRFGNFENIEPFIYFIYSMETNKDHFFV